LTGVTDQSGWGLSLFWRVGVAAHGLMVFEAFSLFGANWEKRQVEKRLRRDHN